jgi:hypothetical protein
MRYDLFELNKSMTRGQMLWRVVVLLLLIAVLMYDLLIGRPG